jgi:selenocysteine-specific elongation factor
MGIVAGTAGHIDHGKSSLVRWLTGTDPDRLKEEKLRGITIELGYVFMPLPGGGVLAFIDVPGHEKFVRQMVAGVATIDFFLLVVAADEGVMPQTREHFDILRLLGVGTGLVALTKCDMVDSDVQELAEAEIAELFQGTGYQGTRIVRVSSVTGDGMETLREALVGMASAVRQRDSGGGFRLAIDRVFTLQGHGTVVAGTVLSGHVTAGDTVEIQPGGRTYRIREIRVNETRTKGAGRAGDRVALNLVGLEKEDATRGSCLATPGWIHAVSGVDAECTLLPGCSLAPRQRVRFHVGTAEVMARALPMAEQGLEPGAGGFVHFMLEEPVVALPGDRFVIRRYSPVTTIGGGFILETGTAKLKKRMLDERLHRAELLSSGDIGGLVRERLEATPLEGISPQALSRELGKPQGEVDEVIGAMVTSGTAYLFRDGSSDRIVDGRTVKKAMIDLLEHLASYHAGRPLSLGLPSSQVARVFQPAPQWFVKGVTARLLEEGAIRKTGERVARADHPEALDPAGEERLQKALDSIEARGFEGYDTGGGGVFALEVEALLERGMILELEKGLVSTARVAAEAGGVLGNTFGTGEFRLGELRETLKIPRKTAVLWAELLDRLGITGRSGDMRFVSGNRV